MAEMGDRSLWLTLALGFSEESLNAEMMVTVMKETTCYKLLRYTVRKTMEKNPVII